MKWAKRACQFVGCFIFASLLGGCWGLGVTVATGSDALGDLAAALFAGTSVLWLVYSWGREDGSGGSYIPSGFE